MNKILAACSIVATVSCLSGCAGGLSEMCAKSLPVLTKSNSLATDASVALENAADLISRSTVLSVEQKDEAQKKIEAARVALQSATSALSLVSESCAATDYVAIFRDFNTLWSTIRPFLALVGNTGGATMADPAVWRMRGGK